MKQLYFCRHGQSQHNKDGLLAGSTETPLTDEGRDQARQAGQEASTLHIQAIVCSPLSRAHETAQIIATEIGIDPAKIVVSELVIERHFGSLEGQPWKPHFHMTDIHDAETVETILERARQAYAYIKSLPADNILVVSHSSFGRALRHVVTPEIPQYGSPRFENATIVQLL